jgi:DHA1 family multidrug resistance protein-like MFS transporter
VRSAYTGGGLTRRGNHREGRISTPVGRLRGAITTPWIRTVVVLTMVQVVSELAFSFALPFTPLYIQELGVTDLGEVGLWAGLIAGLFAVSMGGMAPIWGIAADRFGHRMMIQRAAFGAGIAIACIALVQTPEQLLVLRIGHGVFTGVVTAIATLVSLTAPRQHLGTVLGLLQAAQFLGVSLGPLLGGAFADRFGLRAAFASTGIMLVGTGILVTLFVPEPVKEAPRADASTSASRRERQRLLSREVVVVVCLMALVRYAQTAPQPFLPLYVQQIVGAGEGLATTVGIVLAATGIASSVSALTMGRLSDRVGQRTALVGSLILATIFTCLHAVAGTVWQLVVLRIAVGLAQGGSNPAIQALLIDVTPAGRRGAAFGLLTMANSAGNGGGPVIGSAVAASFGIPAVFLASAPGFGIAAWIVARLRPTGSRARGSAPSPPATERAPS